MLSSFLFFSFFLMWNLSFRHEFVADWTRLLFNLWGKDSWSFCIPSSLSSSHCYPCLMCKLPTHTKWSIWPLNNSRKLILWINMGISSSPYEFWFPESNTIHSWSLGNSMWNYCLYLTTSQLGSCLFSPASPLELNFVAFASHSGHWLLTCTYIIDVPYTMILSY